MCMSYDSLPDQQIIDQTLQGLGSRNIKAYFVQTKAQALEKVKSLIPDGQEVMTGSSKTLEEIGFVDLLKSGQHPWKNLKQAIVNEQDKVKQSELRRQSVLSQNFLGSVHAITQAGQLLTASASGSQLPSYAFTSNNVIWVVGAQKIVPTLDDAFKRLQEYVFPLEDAHMKSLGAPGSSIAKVLIFERENLPQRNIHLILVNEKLGF